MVRQRSHYNLQLLRTKLSKGISTYTDTYTYGYARFGDAPTEWGYGDLQTQIV